MFIVKSLSFQFLSLILVSCASTETPTSPPIDTRCANPTGQAELAVNRKTILDFDCHQLDFCDDPAGFEAILNLHFQLDEDANGDVDILESNEFLRDNLQYENGAEQRQKGFHVANDKHITVDELWHIWKSSSVHNWSVDQTIHWLVNVVELPVYAEIFAKNRIDGVAMPRLAASSQFLSQLSINNPIHRQKINLKAMDVVLFGVPKQNLISYWAAIILSIIVIVLCFLHYLRKQSYEQEINKMINRMDTVEKMEEQFKSMQSELDRTKQENETHSREKKDLELKLKEHKSSNAGLKGNNNNDMAMVDDFTQARVLELEQEVLMSRAELKRLNASMANCQWPPPIALQQRLQLTHEIENKNYNAKKLSAEMQLLAAREGCDKLKRKRSSLLGAFRMAHGSSLDYVDSTIMQARTLLNELTNEMQERTKRWKQIEALCGFDIIRNPGLAQLELMLYGKPINSVGATGAATTTTVPSPTSSTNTVSATRLVRNGSSSTLVNALDDDTVSMKSGISSGYFSAWPNTITYATIPSKKFSSPSLNFPGLVEEDENDDSSGLVLTYDEAAPPTIRKRSIETITGVKTGFNTSVTFATTTSPLSSQVESGGHDRPKNLSFSSPPGVGLVVSKPKPSLRSFQRGSSDGVEKHFEQMERYDSSQSITSSGDSVSNRMARANMPSSDTGSGTMMNADGSKEDVVSSSSSDSQVNASSDLSENTSASKMSNFFGMRKKKSSKLKVIS